MSFQTLEFLLFFPAVFLLHWSLPHRFRWPLLLLASWLFYFWWAPWAGLLLVGTTLVSWLCALGVHGQRGRVRRFCLLTALAVPLGCLALFKYAGFFASIAGAQLSLRLILPVGISFYTFQTLSYVLDVYRGKTEPERHFGYYALFVSFFPQLVAGPIERPEHLLPQLRRERRFSVRDLSSGGWLLLTGYFKKLVVADLLAPLVDRVYAGPGAALGPQIAAATVLFGIQIYCDFSGYTDIARGAAKLLGIDLMENFHAPYSARTIRDFWRRWHISLTSWFTDYVYIPLGGSRRGTARRCLNIMAVFLLSGLWHGADWTFVLWGGVHGLYQIGGILYERCCPARLPDGRWTAALQRLRTFALVTCAWVFFRAETVADALTLLSRLGTGWTTLPALLGAAAPALLPPLLMLVCLSRLDRLPPGTQGRDAARDMTVFSCLLAIGLGWWISLASSGTNAFIYFQF